MVEYVTVYCNVPMGMRLRLHEKRTENEQVMGGGSREFEIWRFTGDEVVLNGNAAPHGQQRRDRNGNFVFTIAGYGATPNVDKEFWDKWLAQNHTHQILSGEKPGLFARGKPAEAQAQAEKWADARSGLEPLTPTLQDAAGRILQTDPRVPRGVSRHEGVRAA